MEILELIELVDYDDEINAIDIGGVTGGCCLLWDGGCAGNNNDTSETK